MSENLDKRLVTRQIKRLKEKDPGLIRCRVGADRHHWERVQPDWEPSNSAMPVAYQCARCDCIKRMDVDPKYGFIIGSPNYEYPDGYLLKREEGDGPEPLSSSFAVRAVSATFAVDQEIRRLD